MSSSPWRLRGVAGQLYFFIVWVDWTDLAQGKNQWRALAITALKIGVP
jgi:hypothetical protein